jgi:hypothetical protein
MELVSDPGHVEPRFSLFGDSVSVVQDRLTVCAEHKTCSKIILDAHDGTARRLGPCGISFLSI